MPGSLSAQNHHLNGNRLSVDSDFSETQFAIVYSACGNVHPVTRFLMLACHTSTASHLMENIVDPKMIKHTFDSEEHSPSVFELAIDAEAATFLNTPRARHMVQTKWVGALWQNLDSDVLSMLVHQKFNTAINHSLHSHKIKDPQAEHRAWIYRFCDGNHGLWKLWRTIARLCVQPARYLQSPLARFVVDCILFFIHILLHQVT